MKHENNMKNQASTSQENNQGNIPEKNTHTGLNKNVKIALIVIGILVVLGIVWRVQAYITYHSYKKQADTLQKAAEDYQKTYLKQVNDMSKQVLKQQQKAVEETNKQLKEMK